MIRDKIVSMIRIARITRDDRKKCELEIRVGQYTTDTHEFQPGYTADHAQVVTRLLTRLQNNSTHMKQTWEMQMPYIMVRAEYDGIRQTSRPPFADEFTSKKALHQLNVLTERPYHLRVALNEETDIDMTPKHPMYDKVAKQPPNGVRIIQRATFIERCVIPGENFGGSDPLELSFGWDISKVSESKPDKEQAANSRYTYHCEVELLTRLVSLASKTVEEAQNGIIADMMWARGCALLGTTLYKTGEPLPSSKFSILSSY